MVGHAIPEDTLGGLDFSQPLFQGDGVGNGLVAINAAPDLTADAPRAGMPKRKPGVLAFGQNQGF